MTTRILTVSFIIDHYPAGRPIDLEELVYHGLRGAFLGVRLVARDVILTSEKPSYKPAREAMEAVFEAETRCVEVVPGEVVDAIETLGPPDAEKV